MVVTNPDVSAYQGMSMFLVPTDTPGVNIVRNVGLMGERLGTQGHHALIHYENVRVPRREPARRRGSGVRDRADPAGRRPHPPRDAHGRHVPEGARHDVRARACHARRRAVSSPTSRACRTTIADSYAELLQFRLFVLYTAWTIDQYKDYRKVRHDIAAVKVLMPQVLHEHRAALDPGARRARRVERDAARWHVDVGAGHGARRRARPRCTR